MPAGARKIVGYSDISEQAIAQASVYAQVVNQDVIVNADATTMKVYVNGLATVQDYVPGTGVSVTADGSNYVTVSNNVENAVNEILDGYTVETAPADYVVSRLFAGFLAQEEKNDTLVFAGMNAEGTVLVAAGGDKPVVGTIYADILAIKQALDTAKAPKSGRALLATSQMANLLLHVDSKIVLDTSRGDMIQTEGYVGRLLGFDIFETELLPAGVNLIGVQKRGYAAKEVFKVEPRIQDLDASGTFIGDSAVQSRQSFLYGVIRPTFIQINKGAA